MKNNQFIKWIPLILMALIFLTSCAPGNLRFNDAPAGFWAGLWHGLISLVTFIISLFNDQVGIYEMNNTGWSYNLGFIIGIMIFYGGSSKSSCRKWW
ncbi:MAG: hypothetical protein FJY10_06455 [Bacteroidetes bacterium]|nr:hypothetical protein [Bacteroidota bacterium]